MKARLNLNKGLVTLLLLLFNWAAQGQTLTLSQLSNLLDSDNNTRDLYLSNRGWQLAESGKDGTLNTVSWCYAKPDSTVGGIVNVLYGGKSKILTYFPQDLTWFNTLRANVLQAKLVKTYEGILENGTRTQYTFNGNNLSFMITYEMEKGVKNTKYYVMLDNMKRQ